MSIEFVEDKEYWTQEGFDEYLKSVLKHYLIGDDFYKKYQWKDINKMFDDVMTGKIVVRKCLTNKEI